MLYSNLCLLVCNIVLLYDEGSHIAGLAHFLGWFSFIQRTVLVLVLLHTPGFTGLHYLV